MQANITSNANGGRGNTEPENAITKYSRKVDGRNVENVVRFSKRLRNLAIRLSYPERRLIADMCIECTRAVMMANTTGMKPGYKVGAEICYRHRHDWAEEKAEKIKRHSCCGTGAICAALCAFTVAIPWGVAKASFNLLSGSTVKTAIKSDIETVSNAGFGEIDTVINEMIDSAFKYIDKVDNKIEKRREK